MFGNSPRRQICFLQLGILAGQALAAAATSLTPVGSTQIPFDTGGKPPGIWSGGAFLTVDDAHSAAPVLRVLDKNGQILSQDTFTIPGARLINIYYGQFARGLDGSLAVAGSAYTEDSKGTVFLAWISADRQRQTVVRTTPFIPHVVTVASDGTVWTAGREVADAKNVEKADYSVLRRYDRAGQLLGSFIPRSSLALKALSLPPADYSWLISSRDSVGWYSQVAHRYIEFGLDGSIIKQFPTLEPGANTKVNGLALCDNGSLFVSAERFGTSTASNWGVFALDRDRVSWDLLKDSNEFGMLYGCDGGTLATRGKSPHITWLSPVTKP